MALEEVQEKRAQLEAEKKKLQDEVDSWESCKRSTAAEVSSKYDGRGDEWEDCRRSSVAEIEGEYDYRHINPLKRRIAEIDRELAELNTEGEMGIRGDVKKVLRDAPEKKMDIGELSSRLAGMGSVELFEETENVVFDMVLEGEVEYNELVGVVILLPEKDKLARQVQVVLGEIAHIEPRYLLLQQKLKELQALCKDPEHKNDKGSPCPACTLSVPTVP